MAMQHEKLPKDQAPRKGDVYTVCHGGAPLYDAEIVKYGGGCWATVRVVEARSEVADMYRPGDTFDMRVAMYEFRERTSDQEQGGEPVQRGGDCG